MKPIIDPRDGDIEDDASSTKRRVEIGLPKLALAWTLLIGLPGLILGLAPLLVSLWIGTVSWKASILLTGIWPVVLLLALAGLAWFAGLPLMRLIESSFWSLNALGVQPFYTNCREGLRHLTERRSEWSPSRRPRPSNCRWTISLRVLDRGASPPCRRISQTGEGAVRAHRHGPDQWQLVCAAWPDDRDTYFYVHTLAVGADGKLRLLEPDRIDLPGRPFADHQRLKAGANS
jgi:hypothetical protein